MSRRRYSLHRTRSPQQCDLCLTEIPVLKLPDYAEYWRVKGGDSADVHCPHTICCLCHAIFDYPTDGWTEAPDGRAVIAALTPALGRAA